MTTKTPLCNLCNRIIGPKSCRQEESGWYCAQRGLLVGVGVEVIVPERPAEPWANDPTLLAATEAETAAQRAYDDADTQWMRALKKLSEHRIQTANELQYMPTQGWTFKATDSSQKKLKEAEATARQMRDDASEYLRAARVQYSAALAAAPHDYQTRMALLPHAIGTACPRCGKLMLEHHDLRLARRVPLTVDTRSKPDRIEHSNCNHATYVVD